MLQVIPNELHRSLPRSQLRSQMSFNLLYRLTKCVAFSLIVCSSTVFVCDLYIRSRSFGNLRFAQFDLVFPPSGSYIHCNSLINLLLIHTHGMNIFPMDVEQRAIRLMTRVSIPARLLSRRNASMISFQSHTHG